MSSRGRVCKEQDHQEQKKHQKRRSSSSSSYSSSSSTQSRKIREKSLDLSSISCYSSSYSSSSSLQTKKVEKKKKCQPSPPPSSCEYSSCVYTSCDDDRSSCVSSVTDTTTCCSELSSVTEREEGCIAERTNPKLFDLFWKMDCSAKPFKVAVVYSRNVPRSEDYITIAKFGFRHVFKNNQLCKRDDVRDRSRLSKRELRKLERKCREEPPCPYTSESSVAPSAPSSYIDYSSDEETVDSCLYSTETTFSDMIMDSFYSSSCTPSTACYSSTETDPHGSGVSCGTSISNFGETDQCDEDEVDDDNKMDRTVTLFGPIEILAWMSHSCYASWRVFDLTTNSVVAETNGYIQHRKNCYSKVDLHPCSNYLVDPVKVRKWIIQIYIKHETVRVHSHHHHTEIDSSFSSSSSSSNSEKRKKRGGGVRACVSTHPTNEKHVQVSVKSLLYSVSK